jgi:protein SCO1
VQEAGSSANAGGSDGRPMETFDNGKYMFGRDCIACHTIGHGDSLGPDLLGVTRLRTHEWLKRMIQAPDEMLDGQDPIATALLKKYNNLRMPNTRIGDLDAAAILDYLQAQDTEHDKQTAASGSEGKKTAAGSNGTAHPNH